MARRPMLARLVTRALPALGALALAPGALSAPEVLKARTFHFGTHLARTTITFVSEAELETIHGVTHHVRGSVAVAAGGGAATADLRVGVRTLKTGISLRDEHLRSDAWLDAARYPDIRLVVSEAKASEDRAVWEWKGSITIKGVTRALSGQARVRFIPASLGQRLGEGEWVRVRQKFQVRLSDFGIQIPDSVAGKVSEVWEVGVDVYGTTVLPRKDR